MSTFEQLLEKETGSIPNNSTKIFNLEKAIAELVGTQAVMKKLVIDLHTEVVELRSKINGQPQLTTEPIEKVKLTLDSNMDIPNVDTTPFQPNINYISTIKKIMGVTEYTWNEKQFNKYLIEVAEKPGVYEIHRDCNLKPFNVGTKLQHMVDKNKFKGYQVIQ
jgi:hypothetical protein